MSRRRVVLFDIDNTLLYTGGAGSHAMNRAFAELYGVDDGFRRIEFSGRTDLFILQGGLEHGGIEGGAGEHLPRFIEAYIRLLPESLRERDGHVMPGFPELLEALRGAGAMLGLATGNFSDGVRLKLDFYDLSRYFEGGGYGEVSLERSDVVAAAMRAVANGATPEDVIVVGDTPHDITAALANGALGVGVATGTYAQEDLHASGAHAVFPDFSDWQAARPRSWRCRPALRPWRSFDLRLPNPARPHPYAQANYSAKCIKNTRNYKTESPSRI
ncbi:MAG TPA: HAD family hydrolase [Dehalococcoidia bacterium]|nr:HAD family hydrolase [Dehalococcoidia bacterium]